VCVELEPLEARLSNCALSTYKLRPQRLKIVEELSRSPPPRSLSQIDGCESCTCASLACILQANHHVTITATTAPNCPRTGTSVPGSDLLPTNQSAQHTSSPKAPMEPIHMGSPLERFPLLRWLSASLHLSTCFLTDMVAIQYERRSA
jgi:hypothetical protein